MKPDLENSRNFAMTLAHRAVRDVRRDGFRQLRNYVDMCALLAQRPDLKRFLTMRRPSCSAPTACIIN